MSELPIDVFDPADVRAMDGIAIDEYAIPGYTLMERAARASLRHIRAEYPGVGHLAVVCGAGNNGGDGYVLARLAAAAGLTVDVHPLLSADKLRGDAARALEDFAGAGGRLVPLADAAFKAADVIVDALLGTGLARDVDGDFARCIARMNSAATPCVSLDIPSGIDAADGRVRGSAVQAVMTVSFVGLKTGLFLGAGAEYSGRLRFDDLGVPADVPGRFRAVLRRLSLADLQVGPAPRPRGAHKGQFGHVLVIGGGPGMPGAVRLAGEAALRSGAGLVSIATWPDHATQVAAARPELMCYGLRDGRDLDELLQRASVVAIGPGLGRSAWAQSVLERSLGASLPLVVDADALNLIATMDWRRDDWILTPHPGEAARLLGTDSESIQKDRRVALGRLIERYGGVAILKGACTLIGCAGETPRLCNYGNPGMAAPGMGDVLTGIVAALLGQGLAPLDAAAIGVLAHALAGDEAARGGERGVLASDLFAPLRRCLNSTLN